VSPQTLDNIALACALAALAMRFFDRPWASGVLSSVCLASATAAQWITHRNNCRREIAARPITKQPAIANEAKGP
jgi:hypothetical protein